MYIQLLREEKFDSKLNKLIAEKYQKMIINRFIQAINQ
jgi:hypothetical protein